MSEQGVFDKGMALPAQHLSCLKVGSCPGWGTTTISARELEVAQKLAWCSSKPSERFSQKMRRPGECPDPRLHPAY